MVIIIHMQLVHCFASDVPIDNKQQSFACRLDAEFKLNGYTIIILVHRRQSGLIMQPSHIDDHFVTES